MRGFRLGIVAVLVLSGWASIAWGNPPPAPADAAKVFPATSFLTQRETWAALAVLVFGLAMAGLASVLLRIRRLPPGDAVRLIALVLIVSGTLFMVTAGYTAEQIAPALGLLGTVAGYMLGRSDRETKESGDGQG